jgi:hypothetical protein
MELDTVVKDGAVDLHVPLPFPEGAAIRVVIELKPPVSLSKISPDPRRAARLLAEIANMPEQNPGGFSGRDHDKVLYSREANP